MPRNRELWPLEESKILNGLRNAPQVTHGCAIRCDFWRRPGAARLSLRGPSDASPRQPAARCPRRPQLSHAPVRCPHDHTSVRCCALLARPSPACQIQWSRSNGRDLTHAGFGDARRSSALSPSADIQAGRPLRLFRSRQQWRLKLAFQRSSIRRSRGGSTGWLINGYSRAKLTITAIAP